MRQKRIQWNDSSGMTLVEVMMSMAIVTTAILASFYFLSMAQQISEEARGRLVALNTIRSVLEVVKDTPIQGLDEIDTDELIPTELRKGTVTIATNPGDVSAANLATVTITVTWEGPKEAARTMEVTTMRSRF